MKFKTKDILKHDNNQEVDFVISKPIGSDKVKEIYFGMWRTRKTNPKLYMVQEYLILNKKYLNNWKKVGCYGI